MARMSAVFRSPSGSRERSSEKRDAFPSTTTRRRSATSRSTRLRRASTSRSSWRESISTTSTETTSERVAVSQPRAVDRGTPRRVACTRSPVDRTISRRRWSYLRWTRVVDFLDHHCQRCPGQLEQTPTDIESIGVQHDSESVTERMAEYSCTKLHNVVTDRTLATATVFSFASLHSKRSFRFQSVDSPIALKTRESGVSSLFFHRRAKDSSKYA